MINNHLEREIPKLHSLLCKAQLVAIGAFDVNDAKRSCDVTALVSRVTSRRQRSHAPAEALVKDFSVFFERFFMDTKWQTREFASSRFVQPLDNISSEVLPGPRLTAFVFLSGLGYPAVCRATKNIYRLIKECSSPRKSLVKGERFMRGIEEKPG